MCCLQFRRLGGPRARRPQFRRLARTYSLLPRWYLAAAPSRDDGEEASGSCEGTDPMNEGGALMAWSLPKALNLDATTLDFRLEFGKTRRFRPLQLPKKRSVILHLVEIHWNVFLQGFTFSVHGSVGHLSV